MTTEPQPKNTATRKFVLFRQKEGESMDGTGGGVMETEEEDECI